MRLMVIGPPGSGKTTLCRRISTHTTLPIHHVDALFFDREWRERPTEEFGRDHAAILEQERWILDGNATQYFAPRAARATHLIYMKTPRLMCTFRVLWRWWRHRKGWRSDRPVGSRERIVWGLFRYMWRYNRRYGAEIRSLAAANPHLVYLEHYWPQRLHLAQLGYER